MKHTYTHRTFDSHSEREHRLAYELPTPEARPVVPTAEKPDDALKVTAGGKISKLQEQANVLRGRMEELARITGDADKKLADASNAVQQKMNALLQRQSFETADLDKAINAKVEEVYKTIQDAEAVLQTAREAQSNPTKFREAGVDARGWQQYSFELPGTLQDPGPVYWFNGTMHSMGYSCEPFSRFNAGATVDNTMGGPEYAFRVVREDLGGGKLKYTLRVNPSFKDPTGRNPGVINIGTAGPNILRTNAVPAPVPVQDSVLKDLNQKDIEAELGTALRPAPLPVAPPTSTLPPVIVPPGRAPEGPSGSVDLLLKATNDWVMMKELGVNEEVWKTSYVRRIGSIVYTAEKGSNDICKILGNNTDGTVSFTRLTPAEKHTFLTVSMVAGVLHDGTAPGLLPTWNYAHNGESVIARNKETSVYKRFNKGSGEWDVVAFADIPADLKTVFGLPPIVPPGSPETAPDNITALPNGDKAYVGGDAITFKVKEGVPLKIRGADAGTAFMTFKDNETWGGNPWPMVERKGDTVTITPPADNGLVINLGKYEVVAGASGEKTGSFELTYKQAEFRELLESMQPNARALEMAMRNSSGNAGTDTAITTPLNALNAAIENAKLPPGFTAQQLFEGLNLPASVSAASGLVELNVSFDGKKIKVQDAVKVRETNAENFTKLVESLGAPARSLELAMSNTSGLPDRAVDAALTALNLAFGVAKLPDGYTLTNLFDALNISRTVSAASGTVNLEVSFDGKKITVGLARASEPVRPPETAGRGTEVAPGGSVTLSKTPTGKILRITAAGSSTPLLVPAGDGRTPFEAAGLTVNRIPGTPTDTVVISVSGSAPATTYTAETWEGTTVATTEIFTVTGTPAPAPREAEGNPTDMSKINGTKMVENSVDPAGKNFPIRKGESVTVTKDGRTITVTPTAPDNFNSIGNLQVKNNQADGDSTVYLTGAVGLEPGTYTITVGTETATITVDGKAPDAEGRATELPTAGTVLTRNVETSFPIKVGTEVKITGPTDPTLPITLKHNSHGVVGGLPVEQKGTAVSMKPDNDTKPGTYTIEVEGLPPTTVVVPPLAAPGAEPPPAPVEKVEANLPVSVDLQVGQPTAFTVPVESTSQLNIVNPDGTSWSGDLASVATSGGTKTENGVTVTVADTVPPSGSWNVTVTFINALADGETSRSHSVSVAGKNMNVNILPPGLTPGVEPPAAPAGRPGEKPVETTLPRSGLVLERYKGETFPVKKDAKVTISRVGGASSEFAPGRTDTVDGLAVSYAGTSVTIEANAGTAPGTYMIEVPNGLEMLSTTVVVPELPPAGAPPVPRETAPNETELPPNGINLTIGLPLSFPVTKDTPINISRLGGDSATVTTGTRSPVDGLLIDHNSTSATIIASADTVPGTYSIQVGVGLDAHLTTVVVPKLMVPPAVPPAPGETASETRLTGLPATLVRGRPETFPVKKDTPVTVSRIAGTSSEVKTGTTGNVDGLVVEHKGSSVTIKPSDQTAAGTYTIEVPNGGEMLSATVTVPDVPAAVPPAGLTPATRDAVGKVAGATIDAIGDGVKLVADVLKGIKLPRIPRGVPPPPAGVPPEGGTAAVPPTAPEVLRTALPASFDAYAGGPPVEFTLNSNEELYVFNRKGGGAVAINNIMTGETNVDGIGISRGPATTGKHLIRINMTAGRQGDYKISAGPRGSTRDSIIHVDRAPRKGFPDITTEAAPGKTVRFVVGSMPEGFNMKHVGNDTFRNGPSLGSSYTFDGITVSRTAAPGGKEVVTVTVTADAPRGECLFTNLLGERLGSFFVDNPAR